MMWCSHNAHGMVQGEWSDAMPWQHVGHIRSSSKEKLCQIIWRTYNRWQITLIPIVSSSGITYANVVSIPTKEHNRYMTYITTYPPSGAHAFNAARTVMHTLQEHIHVLRKRPQDIPRSPRSRCVIVASHTIDIQPLPHDRDYPQANLILRRRVRDSHHPAEGTYLISFSSVHHYKISKLHKANVENKSELACHLLRLL
jgi:hypothetical protein